MGICAGNNSITILPNGSKTPRVSRRTQTEPTGVEHTVAHEHTVTERESHGPQTDPHSDQSSFNRSRPSDALHARSTHTPLRSPVSTASKRFCMVVCCLRTYRLDLTFRKGHELDAGGAAVTMAAAGGYLVLSGARDLPIGAQPGAKTQKTVPAQNLSNDEARAPRPLGHARLHTRRS